jgi:hypothetical protein
VARSQQSVRAAGMRSGRDFVAVNKSVQPWETICSVTPPIDGELTTENVTNSNWLFRVAKQIASFTGRAQ